MYVPDRFTGEEKSYTYLMQRMTVASRAKGELLNAASVLGTVGNGDYVT